MPAILFESPQKTKRFLDIRHLQRVVELVQSHLANETIANHPLEDDLHLGAVPNAPTEDRPGPGGDE